MKIVTGHRNLSSYLHQLNKNSKKKIFKIAFNVYKCISLGFQKIKSLNSKSVTHNNKSNAIHLNCNKRTRVGIPLTKTKK